MKLLMKNEINETRRVKNQFKKHRNQVKAYAIVQSHLSDMLHEIDYGLNSILKENTTTRIGFIDYMIRELNGNLDQYVDPNAMFIEYKTKFVNS